MKVVADISMSLDGFVTGPNAGLHNGLGDGGEPLHTWAVDGRDVVIMGGGDVIGSALAEGLVDELRIHLAPIVLGGGTPLFKDGERCELTQQAVQVSSTATHVTYTVG
jgi:dihydrofolate reductase